ncbi:DUF7344 domain-containing protein [Haloarchaeobius baliensis]|uniref:DUF7344 domain-containing protein n=1 Tax=Haloarchaeobius baliensis TaxID=1670458 RepID=UPI003F881290
MDDTDRREVVGNDRLLDLLSVRRRRQVLATLSTGQGPLSVEELGRQLSDDDSQVERVQLELHHTHLPKLDEAGLVDYDTGSGAVALAVPPEAVATGVERAAASLHELVLATRNAE